MWRLAALSALGISYVLAGYERPYDDLGTVIFSSVLFRHGDRAPLASFPNDPYKNETLYWPRGFGQLTELGEEQHYKLGSYLRERYAHMLPLVYNVNDTYIRSTNYDRTLMSAQCNLAGLYPWFEGKWSNSPIMFQAIPIHTETISNDNILCPSLSCPKYTKLLSYLKDSDEYECVMKATAQVQKDVAKLAGLDEFKPAIADTLYVEETHNLRIPDCFSPYYPNPLKTMYLFFDYATVAGTRELQKLAAGPLLKEMVTNMQHKANGTLDPDRRLYIYSAHDNSIVNLLQALNVFNGIMVPYASTVLVELRVLLGSYYTSVFYKNSTTTDPYLLQIPGCKPLCPLELFIDLTKDVIPDDVSAECAEEVEEEKEYDFEVPVNDFYQLESYSIHWDYVQNWKNTVTHFDDTCTVSWDDLQVAYLPAPTTHTWLSVAEKYSEKWNLLNCFGSVDGKHIRVECPPNSGSQYHNYKQFFSRRWDKMFIAVDIGTTVCQSQKGWGGKFHYIIVV